MRGGEEGSYLLLGKIYVGAAGLAFGFPEKIGMGYHPVI
jgi:hypothetical protein